ncbi:MAG: hypothetical protein AAGI53_05970 [Planctomycetota bacterium]
MAHGETVSGDLSTDPLAPTSVGLEVGANEVRGTVQAPADALDYFTFEILKGDLLTDLFLLEYTDVAIGGNGDRGYIHIDGPTRVIPGGGTIFDFLGGSHLDRGIAPDETINLLDWLSGAPTGRSGFTASLGAGAYTINVQQTGPELIRCRVARADALQRGGYRRAAWCPRPRGHRHVCRGVRHRRFGGGTGRAVRGC